MKNNAKGIDQEERVRRFFSRFAGDWDSLYGGKRSRLQRWIDYTLRRDIYERFQFAFDEIGPDLGRMELLDIGCGSGVYCFEAAQRGVKRVVGVDIADDMVLLARNRSEQLGITDRCAFVHSSIPSETAIPELDQTFDYLIVMGVMDYISEPLPFLRWCRMHARGCALISFPGRHWFREPLRRWRYRMLGRCALYNYDEKEIQKLCTRAGFSKISVKRLNHSGICYLVRACV